MRSAAEWAATFIDPVTITNAQLAVTIERIQRDALQAAAEVCREMADGYRSTRLLHPQFGGESIMERTLATAAADIERLIPTAIEALIPKDTP